MINFLYYIQIFIILIKILYIESYKIKHTRSPISAFNLLSKLLSLQQVPQLPIDFWLLSKSYFLLLRRPGALGTPWRRIAGHSGDRRRSGGWLAVRIGSSRCCRRRGRCINGRSRRIKYRSAGCTWRLR